MAKKSTTAKKASTPDTPQKKTRAKKTAQKKKPASRGAAPSKSPTVLSARVDIGFGNTLYIRGEGPGLSWNRGAPMDCTASDEWVWSSRENTVPLVCKVLINDEIWSNGEDFRIPSGERLVCYPTF